jgi:hypothetical protein
MQNAQMPAVQLATAVIVIITVIAPAVRLAFVPAFQDSIQDKKIN